MDPARDGPTRCPRHSPTNYTSRPARTLRVSPAPLNVNDVENLEGGSQSLLTWSPPHTSDRFPCVSRPGSTLGDRPIWVLSGFFCTGVTGRGVQGDRTYGPQPVAGHEGGSLSPLRPSQGTGPVGPGPRNDPGLPRPLSPGGRRPVPKVPVCLVLVGFPGGRRRGPLREPGWGLFRGLCRLGDGPVALSPGTQAPPLRLQSLFRPEVGRLVGVHVHPRPTPVRRERGSMLRLWSHPPSPRETAATPGSGHEMQCAPGQRPTVELDHGLCQDGED